MKRYMWRAGEQTGARGPVYSQTGVRPPILLCIVLSMLLLRFLGSLRPGGPRQPPIILHIQAEGIFNVVVHLLHAPIHPFREGEVGVAAIRLQVQHELTGNKHTLIHIFCVCQGKSGFDLSPTPPYCSFVLSLSDIVIFINLSAA